MAKREFDNLGNQTSYRSSTNDHLDFLRNDEFDFNFMEMMDHNSRKHEHTSKCNCDGKDSTMCQKLADIIGGMVITSTPVCVVQRLRNIHATILERRTQSPLALPFALSFEDNRKGKTLNLGESVVLQEEINPFLSALRKRGLIVTAVHNHWLFDNPRLMYMHWENVGDPVEFAKNSFEAAREAGLFK
ncbi:DUF1259 domain-containing protein [Bacillus sp. ISL-18]|uniref:DUF1259 domain-containing protein n=1 Tax=Bacillus sp. ISL-18 TaxID=2819118 RepID=UPI0027DEF809|nr:DUF1259 domain-containing protein [Bacillus sp. ISL-18]